MMQWKSIFCAVIILSPLGLQAQEKKPTTDGKQLALLEESSENITLSSGSRIVKPDSLLISEPPKESKKVIEKEIEEEKIGFKDIPLIGELDYYGKMNALLISYCTSYFNSFSKRVKFTNGKNEVLETMEGILKKNGLPTELKYLAVIESALNGNARSPVGAVGYWQFMAPTAKMMGLVVNGKRDDRKNLHRSTEGASKYLSYLYDQFDDWLLVIAAYNSGPRPVINAMKRTGKNDFWSLKPYLPKETQNHVMAFVATATIMERLQDYIQPGLPSNFDWASLNKKPGKSIKEKKSSNPLLARFSEDELKKMAIVRIDKPMDIELISSLLSIDRRLLGRWNYDYFEFLENYASGSTFNLRIPKEKLDIFIEKKSYLERNSLNRLM